jgi:hypothetical protein
MARNSGYEQGRVGSYSGDWLAWVDVLKNNPGSSAAALMTAVLGGITLAAVSLG